MYLGTWVKIFKFICSYFVKIKSFFWKCCPHNPINCLCKVYCGRENNNYLVPRLTVCETYVNLTELQPNLQTQKKQQQFRSQISR